VCECVCVCVCVCVCFGVVVCAGASGTHFNGRARNMVSGKMCHYSKLVCVELLSQVVEYVCGICLYGVATISRLLKTIGFFCRI